LSGNAKYASGEILFSPDGIKQYDLLKLPAKKLQSIRGKEFAMVFQEPMTSLNPVFTCGHQVMEALQLHQDVGEKEAKKRTIALFERVKLPDPEQLFNRYPHQLSGGQKQRVMIAMAMSGNPSLLICDEPTTALGCDRTENCS
jgi:peptide/nickel transport system ATP-binding protein